jgi:hypothetical protein
MKKLLTLLFTLALAFSLGAPVFAAPTGAGQSSTTTTSKKKKKKAKKAKKSKKSSASSGM